MTLRVADAGDFAALERMLLGAGNWSRDRELLTLDQLRENDMLVGYDEGWPRDGDAGVIADEGHSVVGAGCGCPEAAITAGAGPDWSVIAVVAIIAGAAGLTVLSAPGGGPRGNRAKWQNTRLLTGLSRWRRDGVSHTTRLVLSPSRRRPCHQTWSLAYGVGGATTGPRSVPTGGRSSDPGDRAARRSAPRPGVEGLRR